MVHLRDPLVQSGPPGDSAPVSGPGSCPGQHFSTRISWQQPLEGGNCLARSPCGIGCSLQWRPVPQHHRCPFGQVPFWTTGGPAEHEVHGVIVEQYSLQAVKKHFPTLLRIHIRVPRFPTLLRIHTRVPPILNPAENTHQDSPDPQPCGEYTPGFPRFPTNCYMEIFWKTINNAHLLNAGRIFNPKKNIKPVLSHLQSVGKRMTSVLSHLHLAGRMSKDLGVNIAAVLPQHSAFRRGMKNDDIE
jgi:hypothetical protein